MPKVPKVKGTEEFRIKQITFNSQFLKSRTTDDYILNFDIAARRHKIHKKQN